MTENKTFALVDSNILIYSVDANEKEKQPQALAFLQLNAQNNILMVSTQNLAEFFYNVTEKFEKPLSSQKAQETLGHFSNSFTVTPYSIAGIGKAGELQERFHIHFWDALLAATMLENNVHTIYTENTRDFDKVPGIKAINPFKNKQRKKL